jgi:hypothetical protein
MYASTVFIAALQCTFVSTSVLASELAAIKPAAQLCLRVVLLCYVDSFL